MSKAEKSKKRGPRTEPPHAHTGAPDTRSPINPKLLAALGPGILLLSTVIFYWPILTAQGFFWDDFPDQNFPYRLFASVSLRKGIFPFWNPYVFSGMPFFADVQAAVLYPLNLLMTLFASDGWLSPLLYEYQIIFHVLIGGIGMFGLCRDLGCGRTASTAGALTLMFCGFITTHIFHVNLIQTAVWFPIVILLFRRMILKVSPGYAAATAGVLTVIFLSGYPQLLMHMYYWLAAFYLFLLVRRLRSGTTISGELRRGGLFACVVALSLGMAAVQLLPAKQLGENSSRPTLEFKASTEGSFRPYRFVTLAAPNFFGTPHDTYWDISARDERPGMHSYWETAIYVGIVPLLLALLAFLYVRRPLVRFLGIVGLGALLLAMGDSFFLYRLFFDFLPGFSAFRIPGRFAFLFSISIAICAAFGMQWLITDGPRLDPRQKRRTTILLAALSGSFLIAALLIHAGALKQPIVRFMLDAQAFGNNAAAIENFVNTRVYQSAVSSFWRGALLLALGSAAILLHLHRKPAALPTKAVLIALIAADFLLYGRGYAAKDTDCTKIYAETPLIRQLRSQLQTEYFRINSRSSNPGTTDLGGRHMVFRKNQGSVHHLFLMEGYNPLRLKRQIVDRTPKSLDILNVKYAVHVDEPSGRMGFVLNEDYLPRARMVYRYSVVSDEQRIQPFMQSVEFDPHSSIVLEEQPTITPPSAADSLAWTAEITHYDLNSIDLRVSTPRDGFLVLSEIHYPEWRATVDGAPAPLHRANYALRAIEVPAGEHTVRCYYDSSVFKKGLGLSIVCLLLTVGMGLYPTMRPRFLSSKA